MFNLSAVKNVIIVWHCVSAVKCGEVVPPASGHVQTFTTGVQTRALFSCKPGYHVVGAALLSCLASGLWDSLEPTCGECRQPGDG